MPESPGSDPCHTLETEGHVFPSHPASKVVVKGEHDQHLFFMQACGEGAGRLNSRCLTADQGELCAHFHWWEVQDGREALGSLPVSLAGELCVSFPSPLCLVYLLFTLLFGVGTGTTASGPVGPAHMQNSTKQAVGDEK